jgi:hypothetical protein
MEARSAQQAVVQNILLIQSTTKDFGGSLACSRLSEASSRWQVGGSLACSRLSEASSRWQVKSDSQLWSQPLPEVRPTVNIMNLVILFSIFLPAPSCLPRDLSDCIPLYTPPIQPFEL